MSKRRAPQNRDTSVVLAYVRPREVEGGFMDSVLDVLDYDQHHQGYLDRRNGGGRISMQSSPRIAEARSQVVDSFLKEFPEADYLWWLDADATVDADCLERLMRIADPRHYPIVGGLAFAGGSIETMYPTLYGATRLEDGELEITRPDHDDYPRDALIKVSATGCHCVLIHRNVFLGLAKAYAQLPNGKPNPYPWYAEGFVDHQGRPIGEDVIFCVRAMGVGIPTYVHTGIKTGHLKAVNLDEGTWERYRAGRFTTKGRKLEIA